MKFLLYLVILPLLLTLFCKTTFSQETTYDIDKQNQIDTYLGELNGKHYFYSKYRFFCEESSITIFENQADHLLEVNRISKDLYGIELFIIDNSIYCLSLSNGSGSKDLILTKYDANFSPVESKVLYSLNDQKFLNFRFRKTKYSFGLVMKGQKETYFVRHNISNNTSEISIANSKDLSNHVCSDLAVNDHLQMKVIYDSYQLATDPLFISCNTGEVIPTSLPQEIKLNDNHSRCFRFVQSNDTTLLTSLLFSNKKSRKIIGYTYSKLDFDNPNAPSFIQIINPHFNNETIWTSGEFKDWSNDKYNDNTCNQLIKQVILHNGNLIFFSQGSMLDPNRYNTFQPVATMPFTDIVDRRYQIASNTNHAIANSYQLTDCNFTLLDILVSSINLSKNDVDWSYKTFNLVDPHTPSRVIHNIWEANFATHLKGDELQIISNYAIREFNEDGLLDTKKKASSLLTATTPVKITINLSSGENNTTPLLGVTSNGLSKSRFIAEAFTISKEGILIAILYNLEKGITHFLENYWVTHLKL